MRSWVNFQGVGMDQLDCFSDTAENVLYTYVYDIIYVHFDLN